MLIINWLNTQLKAIFTDDTVFNIVQKSNDGHARVNGTVMWL